MTLSDRVHVLLNARIYTPAERELIVAEVTALDRDLGDAVMRFSVAPFMTDEGIARNVCQKVERLERAAWSRRITEQLRELDGGGSGE